MSNTQPFEPFIVDSDVYTFKKEIGRGRFGSILLAERRVEGGKKEKYAVRCTSIEDDDDYEPDSELVKYFYREVGTYIQIKNHPVICKFYGFTVKPQQIILEYLENGSLQDIFTSLLKGKTVKNWNGTMKSKTVFGIACALLHLQNQKLFHRYLTPSSILFDSNNEPRLVDFAYAKFNADNTEHTVTTSPWPVYRAPEIDTEHYDERVDNFSYGVILYQIITGKEAFDSKLGIYKVQQQIKSDKRPDIPEDANPRLASMIADLWSSDPNDRTDFLYIIKSLYDCDQELFPDTDMDDYNRYRELVLKSIDLSTEQISILNQPKLTKENVEQFQRQLKEAEKGNPKDITKVARSIEKGIGTERDVSEAIKWYQKAADLEEPEALYKIANFYSTGRHQIPADNKQYIKYLKKAFDKKYPPAVNDYAYLLLVGFEGVKKDEVKAVELLQKMSNPPHNISEAMYRLANYYEKNGKTEEAIDYYNRARNEGYEAAHSDYALMLLNGTVVAKNVKEGMKILKQAGERGFPTANFNLGHIYEYGIFGVEKNPELSLKYYELAAKQYYPKALVKVGKAMLRGRHAGVPAEKNEILAARNFHIAAQKGDSEGMHSWASCLQYGHGGIPINIVDAVEFYEKAAEKEFVPSMIRLAELYSLGIKGTRDLQKAREYLEMAKDKGSKVAEEKLAELGL